jgi:hypothetical protein
MSDWLHNLPVLWMSLVVFGFTYLVTAAIYVTVSVFAVGERARSFKAISLACCRPWVSSSPFLLRSPQARFGPTPKKTIKNNQNDIRRSTVNEHSPVWGRPSDLRRLVTIRDTPMRRSRKTRRWACP